jgi:hypothetical protein
MVKEIALSASVPGYILLDADDDEFEVEGRILSSEEFIARLQERGDIFSLDGEKRLITSEMVSVCLAIMAGIWISETDPPILRSIEGAFTENNRTVEGTLLRQPILNPQTIERPLPPKEISVDKRTLHSNKRVQPSSQASKKGVGDTRSRVVKSGVFALLSGQTKGKTIQGDIAGLGGYADGIDAIISGTGGLKQGVGTGIARKGDAGIGFGVGYGRSGFGGDGSGGIDDLMGGGKTDLTINLKPPKSVINNSFKLLEPKGVGFIGGRNRAEIMRVVLQNIQALRYAYNKRLMDKPELRGKMICKFAIDESGKVLACELIESTLNDGVLENTVNNLILHWRFEKIDKPGDITEIVYPFVFSS